MALSSAFVLANSLRLRRFCPRPGGVIATAGAHVDGDNEQVTDHAQSLEVGGRVGGGPLR